MPDRRHWLTDVRRGQRQLYRLVNRPELHLFLIPRPMDRRSQVQNLKQNLMRSADCEPTSELCRSPPSRHFYASAQTAQRGGIMVSRASNGANPMRSIFALGILIALFTSASAAKLHHSSPHHSQPRNIIVRPRQAVPSGWYKFPGYPPIPPELNRTLDPSNFGGG